MRRTVPFLIFFLILVGTFSALAAGVVYTIHLNPYYSGAFFYIPPSGVTINGHAIFANETLSLSTVPPSSLKKYPKVSNALYGTFKIGRKEFYVVVGSEDGKLKIFISKGRTNIIDECDEVRTGFVYTVKEGSLFTSRYETLVNIHINRDGVEYTYPIMISASMENGKVLPTMYYWVASFMEGNLNIDGRIHTIILGNINGSGVYENKTSDVVSVDNLNFLNSHSIFYPATSLLIDGKSYEVLSISPAGTAVVIKATDKKVKAFQTTVGKVFPNLKMEFCDGTQRPLDSFKDDFVVLYLWKIPYDFALNGPDITIKDKMLNTLETLYIMHRKDGLRVIIAPMYKTDQNTLTWDDQSVEEMMRYNKLDFYILNQKSTKDILKSLDVSPYYSHVYMLGKNNVLLLKSPILVRNIFQSFNTISKSSNEISSFVEAVF